MQLVDDARELNGIPDQTALNNRLKALTLFMISS
jgi:hypothetical protein